MPHEGAALFSQAGCFDLRSFESLQIGHIVHVSGMPRGRAVAFPDHRGVLFSRRRA
jgi:hypothetical protein